MRRVIWAAVVVLGALSFVAVGITRPDVARLIGAITFGAVLRRVADHASGWLDETEDDS